MSLSDTQSICMVSNAIGGSPMILGWPRQVALRSSTKSHIALAKRGVYILGMGQSAVVGICAWVFVWVIHIYFCIISHNYYNITRYIRMHIYICSKIVWTNPRPSESLMFVFNTVVSLQIEWSVSWNHSVCGHVYMLCSPVAVATSEFTGIDSTAVEVTNIMFQTISNRKRTRTGKPITVQPCSTIIDRWLGVTEMRRPFVA